MSLHFYSRDARFFISEDERDEFITIMRRAKMLDDRPLADRDYAHCDSLTLYVARDNLAFYERGGSCGDWHPTPEEATAIRAACEEDNPGPELAQCRGIPTATLFGDHTVPANEIASALAACELSHLDLPEAALSAVEKEDFNWGDPAEDVPRAVQGLVRLWNLWLTFLRSAREGGDFEVAIY